ncbi:MAG: outer membrane beta-barrel protein [Melioribacteraceae bacterium]|jgi:opacity protein-like surface antigen|nr:outer membrane beta-barrel protein [Melioribacteraceae bacterium]
MKRITLLLLFFFLSISLFAQENNKAIGINGIISMPIGDFNDIAKIGFGASGTYFYKLSNNFEATGSIGFVTWGGDKIEIGNTSVEATESAMSIPILLGGRFYLDNNIFSPYFSGELGMNFFSSSATKAVVSGIETDKIDGESNVYFGFGIGGGTTYQLDTRVFFDASLQYNMINAKESVDHFALKIGFIVGI